MLAYTKRAANLTALEVWKRRFAAMCHATSRISLNFRSLRPDSVSDNEADNQRQKFIVTTFTKASYNPALQFNFICSVTSVNKHRFLMSK